MKAYKGFDKDLKCRNYQFEIGKTYTEDEAELCTCGFHACLNPIDCLYYYRIQEKSRYCVVDIDDLDILSEQKQLTDATDSKICGKTVKIEKELTLLELIEEARQFIIDHAENAENDDVDDDSLYYIVPKPYSYTVIGASKNNVNWLEAAICCKVHSKILCRCTATSILNSANHCQLFVESGTTVANSGDACFICTCSDIPFRNIYTSIQNSGAGSIVVVGVNSYRTTVSNSGAFSAIYNYGDHSDIITIGDRTIIRSFGNNCIIICTGCCCFVSGKIGTKITMRSDNNKMISFEIDGEHYKEDTLYTLRGEDII
jgi:hypothetical protein